MPLWVKYKKLSGRPIIANALLFGALAMLLWATRGTAATLDWNDLVWTGGSLSQTYYATNTANASTSSNKGIYYADDRFSGVGSVTITLSGGTADLSGGFPKINNSTATGGLSPAQDALQLKVNFTANTQNVTVLVVFNGYVGVQSLSYTLFDVDAANNNSYVDQISSVMSMLTNGTYAAATITGSLDNLVAGSGTNQTVTGVNAAGANSANGNVGIDFGTNVLSQSSFTLGTDPSSKANPAAQNIALYNVTFTPKLPEVGSPLVAVLVCVLAVLPRFRCRRGGES